MFQPKTRPDLAAVAVKRTPAELAALKERVKSEAIPISLGRTPDRDAIRVSAGGAKRGGMGVKIKQVKSGNWLVCVL